MPIADVRLVAIEGGRVREVAAALTLGLEGERAQVGAIPVVVVGRDYADRLVGGGGVGDDAQVGVDRGCVSRGPRPRRLPGGTEMALLIISLWVPVFWLRMK